MKASIVVTNRNYGQYLKAAVIPYLKEGSSDTEIIIVDDASTDGSQELIHSLLSKDSRIKSVFHEISRGPAASYNSGIRAAQNEIVLIQSADDEPLPGRLQAQVNALETSSADIVGGGMLLFNAIEGNLREEWYPLLNEEIIAEMPLCDAIAHPTAAHRRSVILSLGGYDETLSASVDTDLWLKAIRKGIKFANLPMHLVRYRVHEQSITSKKYEEQKNIALKCRANFLGTTLSGYPESILRWTEAQLEKLISSEKIAIYGKGSTGIALAQWAKMTGRAVSGFVESAPSSSMTREELETISPEEAASRNWFVAIATAGGRGEACRRLLQSERLPQRDFIDVSRLAALLAEFWSNTEEKEERRETKIKMWESVSDLIACPLCHSKLTGPLPIFCNNCNMTYYWALEMPRLLSPNWPKNSSGKILEKWFPVLDSLNTWRLKRAKPRQQTVSNQPSQSDAIYRFVAQSVGKGTIIDIGCGNGAIFNMLGKESRYLGIEPNPSGPVDFPCAIAFAEQLPANNETFDSAALMASLDYCFDDKQALREARRVLRANGKLFLFLTLRSLEDALRLRSTSTLHFHYYTLEDVRNLLEKSNFHIESETPSGTAMLFTARPI